MLVTAVKSFRNILLRITEYIKLLDLFYNLSSLQLRHRLQNLSITLHFMCNEYNLLNQDAY